MNFFKFLLCGLMDAVNKLEVDIWLRSCTQPN